MTFAQAKRKLISEGATHVQRVSPRAFMFYRPAKIGGYGQHVLMSDGRAANDSWVWYGPSLPGDAKSVRRRRR